MYQLIVTKFKSEARCVVNRFDGDKCRRVTAVRERTVEAAVKQAVRLTRMARKGYCIDILQGGGR